MTVLASLKVVDLSSCSSLAPSFAKVSLVALQSTLQRAGIRSNTAEQVCKGRIGRMIGRSILCLLRSGGLQDGHRASVQETTLLEISVLRFALASPVLMASASALKLVE